MSALHSTWSIMRALTGGTLRDHPGRVALAIASIAFGVALGVGVHLINSSAANEFDLAMRSLSGDADLIVRGPRGGFDEMLYPRIAALAAVREASPAVEVEAQLAGRRETLRIVGLDPFRAAQVQPRLLGASRDALLDLLKGDTVLLSRAAAEALRINAGETLRIDAGTRAVALRVVGILPAGATSQPLALTDIATAQWRLAALGKLHRIDVRLLAGTDVQRFSRMLAAILPAGVLAATPEIETARNASFTRAYRINLDMLALVALFTGAFLVFSTQFLALLRRRTQLALLRVLGLTGPRLLRLLISEGAMLGVIGSAFGVALGIAIAQWALQRLGGDLGAGYYPSVTPVLSIAAAPLLVYFALGVAFAALGAALPAFEAARRKPAAALKAGDEETALRSLRTPWAPGALVVVGLAASQAPPLNDVPVFGYLAVALILMGAILSMPRMAETVLARLPFPRYAPAALGLAQLQATPRQVGVGLAAIVASFSLMVSMLIMIGSFRVSLEQWLDQMLPADLYVRAGRVSESGFFTAADEARIKAVAGVREAIFVRTRNILLRADRPPMTLIARPYSGGRPYPPVPLEGRERVPTTAAAPAVWLSQVAADLLNVRTGDAITLPLGGALHGFTIAGVWRDYARQNGAIIIDRALYQRLTRDERSNDAALYLTDGAELEQVVARVRTSLAHAAGIEIARQRELKSISLAIFDRTFAVTYALQLAAIVIGLFGVSASFSAQALARRREFGVLRHLGMRRRDIAAMLATEGILVGSLGASAGLALGWLISLILVHVINRQSFHWSLDMHLPWLPLLAISALLVLAASVTAVLSGRRAMSDDVTRAVTEDW